MLLRIVSWNCREALYKKYQYLLALEPDIAIVQECEEPDALRRKAPGFAFSDCEWRTMPYDQEARKGLGIFAFGDHSLRLHQSWSPGHLLFLPVEVRQRNLALNLLGVWAFNGRSKKVMTNPRTTADAIIHYSDFLRAAPSVVAGDFNASMRWEGKRGCASFADLDKRLHDVGLTSAYHTKHGHAFDREPEPTMCFYYDEAKPYHIDYVYGPLAWMDYLQSVEIGAASKWVGERRSDHAPVVAEWDLPSEAALRSVANLDEGSLGLTARR